MIIEEKQKNNQAEGTQNIINIYRLSIKSVQHYKLC